MAGGKMQCCGSPLFLSRSYGVGFTLTVLGSGSNSEDIGTLVRSCVDGAHLINEAGAETIFRIPMAEKSKIPSLIRALESKKNRLGITSFEVGGTTLEEVFMEVERRAEGMGAIWSSSKRDNFLTAEEGNADKTTSSAPIWTQFFLMFKLRLANIRHRPGKMYEFGVPLLFCRLTEPRPRPR
jgi:hypothetical protein